MKNRAYLTGKACGIIGKYLHLRIDKDADDIIVLIPLEKRDKVAKLTADEPMVSIYGSYDRFDDCVTMDELHILWSTTRSHEYEGYVINRRGRIIPPCIKHLEF